MMASKYCNPPGANSKPDPLLFNSLSYSFDPARDAHGDGQTERQVGVVDDRDGQAGCSAMG